MCVSIDSPRTTVRVPSPSRSANGTSSRPAHTRLRTQRVDEEPVQLDERDVVQQRAGAVGRARGFRIEHVRGHVPELQDRVVSTVVESRQPAPHLRRLGDRFEHESFTRLAHGTPPATRDGQERRPREHRGQRGRSADAPGRPSHRARRRLPRCEQPRVEERVQLLARHGLRQGDELIRRAGRVGMIGEPGVDDLEEGRGADGLAEGLERHRTPHVHLVREQVVDPGVAGRHIPEAFAEPGSRTIRRAGAAACRRPASPDQSHSA